MRVSVVASGLILLSSIQWAEPAFAQRTYTCRQANGSVTVSDRPCGDSAPGYVYYGPAQQQQQQSTSTSRSMPRASDAPEHQQYMSGRCAAMNDELRVGQSKGLGYQAMSDLHKNYSRECADDDRQARSQLYAAKRANQTAQLESQKLANQEKQSTELKQQQCDESKRILHAKSARTDLNAGERAELARFKENYQARCL